MWRRAIAYVIDLFPFGLLIPVQNALGVPVNEAIALINGVMLIAYFAGLNYWYGGTVGKQMMGLRVALPASPAVTVRLIARAIVKISCIFPPALITYALIAIWSRDGRSLADFATGSTVVEATTYSAPQPLSFVGKIVASVLAVAAPIICMLALFFFLLVMFGEWKPE